MLTRLPASRLQTSFIFLFVWKTPTKNGAQIVVAHSIPEAILEAFARGHIRNIDEMLNVSTKAIKMKNEGQSALATANNIF